MNSKHNDINNHANAHEYCINKAIPAGSNFYYATLFETDENKTRLIAFHAFLYELNTVIFECKDPGVARIKLKWWQEEIERLSNHKARHPVTQQMQQCININENLITTFKIIIDLFNHYIFIEEKDSLNTILSLFESTYGEIWCQCLQVLNIENKNAETIRELGALIQYLDCLQQPHIYINETRNIIPSSLLSNIDLQKLLAGSDNRQVIQKEKFSQLISDLKSRFEKIQRLLKENKNEIDYDLIMTRLAIKTCDEILADECQLLERKISLTPLRKLWIAWLTRTFR